MFQSDTIGSVADEPAVSAAVDGSLVFQLLGPTEAHQGGLAIPLSGVRRRALLTRFLVDPGQVVSVDTLFEDVWEGRAPVAALPTLQSHISQLRKVLGDR